MMQLFGIFSFILIFSFLIIWYIFRQMSNRNKRNGLLSENMETKYIQLVQRESQIAKLTINIKNELLSNISDEIRKPIGDINSLIDLFQKTWLSVKQRDILNQIHGKISELLEFINEVSDLSRIETGKIILDNKQFNLNDTVESLSDMFCKKVAEKGIELIISIAENVPSIISGDQLRLQQILFNLTNNSIKFSDSGEVIVRVTLVVKISNRISLRFSIKDTSPGINYNNPFNIFDAYSHEEDNISDKFKGSLIGFALCKQLVEMMGGEIWVENNPFEGNTFYFTAEFGLIEQNDDKKVPPVGLNGINILVVDDNESFHDIIKEILKSFTFEAESATSGKDAMEKMLESLKGGKKIDLVLMDLVMPGMDGIEVARQIKKIPGLSNIPVIIMTVFGCEDIKKRAEEAGISAFLIKPVKKSSIFDTIVEVLSIGAAEKLKEGQTSISESEALRRLNGSRVLIADDAYVNLQFAKKILEKFGVNVNVVNNGEKALESVKNNKFDALLMDVQMPVMDGLEATRLIREYEKNNNLEIPIIAMTANSMKNDREYCIESGMNDYIMKPIDPERLFFTLAKWIKYKDNYIENALPQEVIEEGEDFPKKIPGIDIDKGIKRIGGDKKAFKRLLIEFYMDYANSSGEVREALEKHDMEAVLRLVHTYKGIAGNFSAMKLYYIANEIETAVKEGDNAILAIRVSDFENALSQLLDSLKKFVIGDQKTYTEENMPIDMSKLNSLFLKMSDCLLNNDLEADEHLGLLKNCIGDFKFQKDLHLLEKHIRHLDFELAQPALKDLAQKLGISLI